jgi:hypothetical protein
MALLWIDGFEQYADLNDVIDNYDSSQNAGIVMATGRHAGGNNRALDIDFNNSNVTRAIPESTSTIVVGFAYNSGIWSTSLDLLRLWSGGTEMIVLRPSAGIELVVDRGSTQLGITTGLGLIANQWYYIELKVFIHDSTGTVELWVDGSKELDLTSQDTRNGTPSTINRFQLVGNTNNARFDDLYVLDDSGSDATDRLGDVRVETLFPDADGATNDFTAVGTGSTNADRVDDGITPDDDTTYVHSATAADKDLYGFEAITGSVDTVYGVGVCLRLRKAEAGERTVRTVARSSTTEVESADKYLGVDWRYINHIYENDPNGGGNWTEANVNAAQFGLKIQA